MTVTPWQGDACSLVDAFRTGERSPKEELEGVLAAIDASALDAVSFLDTEGARAAAARADASLPFGGVPIGVKELEPVEGWPSTEASLVFADRVADQTTTMVRRLEGAGVVKVAQTTASEFGGLNVSVSKLHGVTHNPWRHDRTAGGSSGGSAAAVAGGLLPIATGGDGGGSIRIPAGFCGLVGVKGTAGRIPRGPRTEIAPLTVVVGCVARSVRDVARWFDVCSGYHPRDPYSLPRVDGWERDVGTRDLRGLSAVIAPDLGNAQVLPQVEARVREAGEALARDAGLRLVDVPVRLPGLGFEWAMANLSQLRKALGDRWPACRDDLTLEMAFGLDLADQVFNLEMAGRVEAQRTEANERMADLFDDVDFVICATNPDVAFPAEIGLNTRVGNVSVGPENNGLLTIPANIVGNPAVSIPAGTVDGLPVGMQVIGRHHADALLLDLARVVENERPWPLVAPGAPV
ncbi:MAG TPA: amidase [Acidimicrobiales bacterium]|jgi:aspartyl-tRNA(Asn)/glutamyl-tRNA(Gln) amidotransferase subunit A|nr:amidase [Acidimicrobiales bacterium]